MKRNRLKIKDLFFVALYGVRARKGRATLTSIGIGIGIAAIVAVSGISASGRADLLSTLESLGTNLVKASPQAGFFGTQEELPKGVLGMVERIGPVQEVTSTTQTDLLVRRSNFISEFEGGGISTIVTSAELLDVIGGNLIDGRFIQDGLSDIPVTVSVGVLFLLVVSVFARLESSIEDVFPDTPICLGIIFSDSAGSCLDCFTDWGDLTIPSSVTIIFSLSANLFSTATIAEFDCVLLSCARKNGIWEE